MPQSPRPQLSVTDGVLLIVGLIVGTGVLRVPASIAQQTTGPGALLAAVLLGGVLAASGAYCYAQLARLYPQRGGEYEYLHRSLGAPVGFLFVWSRCTVLQTGSLAATVFIFADYATKLLPLGDHSVVAYALLAVIGLSVINARGVRLGKTAQNILTLSKVAGLLAIVAAGWWVRRAVAPAVAPVADTGSAPAFGLAMVFVLYAYGGWNEASYLAADVQRGPRGVALVLIVSTGLVAAIYLLLNAAYLRGLGFEALRASQAPAADVVALAFGRFASGVIALLAALIALSTANATIFTGSRAIQAAGANHPGLRWLGVTDTRHGTPVHAFALQGLITMALIVAARSLGHGGQHEFEAAVSYTAPAFWGFMTLVGLVAIAHSWRHPETQRCCGGFLASALILTGMSGYMLYSSIAYAGLGSLLSLAVVALGVPVYALVSRRDAYRLRQETVQVVDDAAGSI